MSNVIDFDLADVLAESREYIEQYGWGRGEFRVTEDEYGEPDDDGECEIVDYAVIGYCAVGGVLYSQDIDEAECCVDPRTRAVADALCRVVGIKQHHAESCTEDGICTCVVNWITNWNDDDERTEQDVLDAFAKAEKVERMGYDPDLGYSDV